MKYRNLKDLADATGFSRYQINRAIEAGLIRPEWLYVSPGSGRRKLYAQSFQHCVEAMRQWWGKEPESPPPGPAPSMDGIPATGEEWRAWFGLQPGEDLPLWVVAAAADVPLSHVLRMIKRGQVPAEWLTE